MPEKLSTHAGFIKAISPWLPDSTGREGLYSCGTDSGWSSVLVSPMCCSESRWRGSGLDVCRPKVAEAVWRAPPFPFWHSRGFGSKGKRRICLNGWRRLRFFTGSQQQFFLRGKSGWSLCFLWHHTFRENLKQNPWVTAEACTVAGA